MDNMTEDNMVVDGKETEATGMDEKKMATTGRRVVLLLVNLAIAVIVFWAWGTMLFGWGGGTLLSARGLRSLRYFTVLSNIFEAIVSLIFVVQLMKAMGRKCALPRWVRGLKLAGTTGITLTFLTVMLFLGPLFGYAGMFAGANLHLHLTVPVLAILEFVLLERTETRVRFPATFTAVIPMLLYGVYYLGNILINGVGEGYETNDWYGFTVFGVDKMYLVFAVMGVATWLMAVALWKIGGNGKKKASKS